MTYVQAVAFDCFGTVFDMDGVRPEDVRAYVEHVNREDFSPFEFPASWHTLPAHPDAAAGIAKLQSHGILCVAMSNGSKPLLRDLALHNGIHWDWIVDFAKHEVYKPHPMAYRCLSIDLREVERARTVFVTANPTFGDVEGSREAGMLPIVIRGETGLTIADLWPKIEAINP